MSNERFNFDKNIEMLGKLDFRLLYASTSKYEGDWQSLPHTHHFTELFYVISGQGNFLIEDHLITVRENDMVIINPNVEHTEKSLDSSPLEYIVFGVEGLTFQFGDQDSPLNYGYYNYSTEKKHLLNFSQLMIHEITEKKSGYERVCHALLEVLIIYITRNEQLVLISMESTRIPKECALVKRYLDANYAQPITLDSLAESTHINKFYLSHTFTKYLGMSPITYLIQRRLQISRDMLTQTDHSIAEIASSTGFASQSYFSQIFRKFSGMSPNQYRKQNTTGKAEDGGN